MKIVYEPKLEAYMKKTGKRNIVVEVASSDSSDFSVEEFYVHFADEKLAESFVKRKHFRVVETELGKVLLPNYRLEYDEVVTFYLKKFLFFPVVKQRGIRF